MMACLLMVAMVTTKAQADKELGGWYVYNGFFNISEKFELFVESQYRSFNTADDPETFFFRPFFNYNVNKQFQVGLGLEYHNTWDYESSTDPDTEFRVTLQSMLFQNVGRVKLQHRYRYEFRNFEESKAQRFRYRLQATVPLNNKTFEKGTIFANAFNEIMVDSQPDLQLSQNRIYAGLGYQLSNLANIQVGYLGIAKPEDFYNRFQIFFTHKLNFY